MPWRLGPLLRSVQDTGDLNPLLSDAVNNDERQAGDNHLARVGLAAWSPTVWHLVQRGGAFIDRVTCGAKAAASGPYCRRRVRGGTELVSNGVAGQPKSGRNRSRVMLSR
jgi:hypothetical protein